jgi:diadenosine tetraphosphate (Ap4A) HIT family hydrolase
MNTAPLFTATAPTDWSLHPQLNRGSTALGDLPLSRVLLINNANFPWLVLVPRRPDVIEIIDLDESDQLELMREIAQASRALRTVTCCDKLNVAALGNAVPQLHVHVIARFRNDAAGAQPVWGQPAQREPKPYAAADLASLMQQLRTEIPLAAES